MPPSPYVYLRNTGSHASNDILRLSGVAFGVLQLLTDIRSATAVHYSVTYHATPYTVEYTHLVCCLVLSQYGKQPAGMAALLLRPCQYEVH